MVKTTAFITLILIGISGFAQQGPFSPQAGMPGSDAIHKDSNVFVQWATSCEFRAGYRQINLKDSGQVNQGNPNYVVGQADAPLTLSLGDSGLATISFWGFIFDGPGADFAVFENGFGTGEEAFLELAFVEASSDGINFFRFPAFSERDTSFQVSSFGNSDASFYHNLAGKYVVNYGVPFDLADLPDTSALDKNHITHIRIVDVIGCIQPEYASRDANGRIINDPWPTNFPQGGFDLDAVGIIHSTLATGIPNVSDQQRIQSEFDLDILGRNTGNGQMKVRINPDGSVLKFMVVETN